MKVNTVQLVDVISLSPSYSFCSLMRNVRSFGVSYSSSPRPKRLPILCYEQILQFLNLSNDIYGGNEKDTVVGWIQDFFGLGKMDTGMRFGKNYDNDYQFHGIDYKQKQYHCIPQMDSKEIDQNQTENSVGLKPIYKKVQELVKLRQAREDHDRKTTIMKIIEPVPKLDLKINIDRNQDLAKRRQKLTGEEIALKTSNLINNPNCSRKLPADEGLRLRTKSEKMLNFLKAHQSQNKTKRTQTPLFMDKFQDNRETFTPMRPISRVSRPPESVTGTQFTKRSGSNNKSSGGGYSQVARLSQGGSNKSSTPSKYLRKGHRMRETLLKQIQGPEDIEEQNDLVYMKEYDQWVPASLASYKRLELEHFMNILIGGKKQEKKEAITFQPIYL